MPLLVHFWHKCKCFHTGRLSPKRFNAKAGITRECWRAPRGHTSDPALTVFVYEPLLSRRRRLPSYFDNKERTRLLLKRLRIKWDSFGCDSKSDETDGNIGRDPSAETLRPVNGTREALAEVPQRITGHSLPPRTAPTPVRLIRCFCVYVFWVLFACQEHWNISRPPAPGFPQAGGGAGERGQSRREARRQELGEGGDKFLAAEHEQH